MDRVCLNGVKITNLTSKELNSHIVSSVLSNEKRHVLNVNIHAMNFAAKFPWFKDLLNSAFINFCDGDGVRLAAKWQGKHIKEKITYNTWIWEAAALSEKNDFSWYIVGSTNDTIVKAVDVLKNRYPALRIVGFSNGYLSDTQQVQKLLNDINLKKPDLLFLGMSMPIQERFIMEYDDKLNYKLVFTAGAAFDYVAGKAKMTPQIFSKFKLEWFYRFLQEPRRLFHRYFVGIPQFFLQVLFSK